MGGNVVLASEKLLMVFNLANQRFFSSSLEVPEITIQTAGKKRAYGWC